MKPKSNKGDKREIRSETHLTRPPRMEGAVKEAMMQPERKLKRALSLKAVAKKPRGASRLAERNYQLRSKRH